MDFGSKRPEDIYREFLNSGLQGKEGGLAGFEDLLEPDTVTDQGDSGNTDVSSVRTLTGKMLIDVQGPGNVVTDMVELADLDYEDVGDTERCDPPVTSDVADPACHMTSEPEKAVRAEDTDKAGNTIPLFDLDSDRFDDDGFDET